MFSTGLQPGRCNPHEMWLWLTWSSGRRSSESRADSSESDESDKKFIAEIWTWINLNGILADIIRHHISTIWTSLSWRSVTFHTNWWILPALNVRIRVSLMIGKAGVQLARWRHHKLSVEGERDTQMASQSFCDSKKCFWRFWPSLRYLCGKLYTESKHKDRQGPKVWRFLHVCQCSVSRFLGAVSGSKSSRSRQGCKLV